LSTQIGYSDYCYKPDAVICARVKRKSDVASICRCPHPSSPTTVIPVATLYLACSESRTLCVYLNFSTCDTRYGTTYECVTGQQLENQSMKLKQKDVNKHNVRNSIKATSADDLYLSIHQATLKAITLVSVLICHRNKKDVLIL